MSKNIKQTSQAVAALAARTLQDENASQLQRRLAGSVLAQRSTGKQTGAEMEDVAARALASKRSAEDTQILAGSLVAQANKER